MKKQLFNGWAVKFISLLLLSNISWGLGKTGHRVTGQIAYNHLTEKARCEVEKLLGDDSLAEVSNWPDQMRSNPDEFWQKLSVSWHYVNIPDNNTYTSSRKNANGDIVKAISAFKAILSDRPIPRGVIKERLESYFGTLEKTQQKQHVKTFALKFLMHLVGDFHQPMHVGYKSDRGGNDSRVHFFNEDTNLHRVWDSHLIDNMQLSYTELVAFIDIDDEATIKQIQKAKIEDWIQEALILRSEAYKIGKGHLRYDYIYKHSPVIKQQLLKSGLRMAALLNEIYQ